MSEPLIVSTFFGDVAELTEGFADRVEEGQIILYGPNGYEEGDRIPFQVLLADGSAALEGTASVIQCVDAGEERDPEFRFDVVLAGLDLLGASDAIFERLLAFQRGEVSTAVALTDDIIEPASAEVAMLDSVQEELPPEPEPEPVREAPVAAAPVPRSSAPIATAELSRASGKAPAAAAASRGVPPPTAPRAPGGFTVELGLAGQLGRQVMPAAWTPEPPPREPSTEPTGHFEYGPSVPIPKNPPRPEMDPARRVAPAPAATTEAAYRAQREALGFAVPSATDFDAVPAAREPAHHAVEAEAADVAEVQDAGDEAFDVGDEAFDMDSGEH
jgi:hypothetical protein